MRYLAALLAIIGCCCAATPQDAGEWQFAAGGAEETLDASAEAMPPTSEVVTLPHSVTRPDTPLWYARELDLTGVRAFRISADDGAQVFVGGARLDNLGTIFLVPPGVTGRQRVIVRVLNNAMAGGLRAVDLRSDPVVPEDPPRRLQSFPYAEVESPEFRAAMPAPDEPCRFTAWADSQGQRDTFASVVRAMSKRTSHFTVGIGDLTSNGADSLAWGVFMQAVSPLAHRTALVAVAGNHDYDGFYNSLRAEHYLRLFRPTTRQPWFAWTCGAVRLVAVDLNTHFPIGIQQGDDQDRWLEAESRSPSWEAARWRVLLVHQPPWSRSWPGYEGDKAARDIVERLAARGLNAVLSGHSHAYEALIRPTSAGPIRIFITGGAGGTLEDAQPDALTGSGDHLAIRHHFLEIQATRATFRVDAMDLAGTVFDRATLSELSSIEKGRVP